MSRKVYSQFWKNIGEADPYFGVLTHEQYRSENLDDESRQSFFASGEQHIGRVVKILQQMNPNQPFQPENALDFGCGTGRLSLALAAYCRQVTGVDIAPAMVAEAEANRDSRKVDNVRFQLISGNSGFLTEQYDYIHTAMVFQHIHPSDGMEILDHLLSHLAPKGKGFFQITYRTKLSNKQPMRSYLGVHYPSIAKLLYGKGDYAFPMFDYDLNAVFNCFQQHQIKTIRTGFGNSGPHQFVRCYLEKK